MRSCGRVRERHKRTTQYGDLAQRRSRALLPDTPLPRRGREAFARAARAPCLWGKAAPSLPKSIPLFQDEKRKSPSFPSTPCHFHVSRISSKPEEEQRARRSSRAFKHLVTNLLDGQLLLSLGHDSVLGTTGGGLHSPTAHQRQDRPPVTGSIPSSPLPFGQSLGSVCQQRHSCRSVKALAAGKKGCNPLAGRALSRSRNPNRYLHPESGGQARYAAISEML